MRTETKWTPGTWLVTQCRDGIPFVNVFRVSGPCLWHGPPFQLNCRMPVFNTTGDFFCRAANFSALSRSM